MSKHALLSASSSHRWIACPPSARLCAEQEDKVSEYARQGTDAHTLCEYKLKKMLGIECIDPTENLSFYDEEMEECADGYAEYVTEQLTKIKEICTDPVVLIEQTLDFSKYVTEGFGTGDCIIVADGTLSVIDYKHGIGVLVSAQNNPQMMCYALGALELFDGIYDVDTVSMTIYQPRRENISKTMISKLDLLKWAEEVLAPTAKLAYAGKGEFKAGEHCQFCKVKSTCRKRMEYNMELARYDFEMPATLSNDEIAVILSKLDELSHWAEDVKEYALKQALSGTKFAGFKIVEGYQAGGIFMNVTKIMNESEKPVLSAKNFTDEELKQEYSYYLAQKLLKKMLDSDMISADEFNKITEKNRKSFSPYLAEIMP